MEKPHKRLILWKTAMELVTKIYRVTKKFPVHEQYGLTNQLRRSAVSIPANIAEGAARQTNKEFTQFLHISQGSLSELDTLMEVARSLRYLTQEVSSTVDAQMIQIDKMLTGLIRKLKNKSNKASEVKDKHEDIIR